MGYPGRSRQVDGIPERGYHATAHKIAIPKGRLMRHLETLFVALVLLLFGRAAVRADNVDDLIGKYMKEQRIPGLSLAVVREGKVIKAKGYGLANLEHDVPTKPETAYQAASLSKQFTATAVMLLVEQGKLSLDDPISKHLAGTPAAWKDVTVRHLLSHTSGIKDYGRREIDFRRDYTEDDFFKKAVTLPMKFPPGQKYRYSNTGYVLLGILIRKLSGEYHGDFLGKRVLQPLGMTATRVISEDDVVPNRAAGYRLVKGKIKNQEWVAPSLNTLADGCLYTTVLDLAKWDAALYTEKVLKRSSLEQMWTPTRLCDGTTHSYGLGWRIGDVPGVKVVQHGGSWQGFRSYIVRSLDDRLTVIVLANLSTASCGRIAKNVAGLYNPKLTPPVPKPIAETEPRVGELVRTILDKAAEDNIDPALFTEEARKDFFPDDSDEAYDLLKNFDRPKSVVPVERKKMEKGLRRYSYLADYGDMSVTVDLALTKEGRIAELDIEEY